MERAAVLLRNEDLPFVLCRPQTNHRSHQSFAELGGRGVTLEGRVCARDYAKKMGSPAVKMPMAKMGAGLLESLLADVALLGSSDTEVSILKLRLPPGVAAAGRAGPANL